MKPLIKGFVFTIIALEVSQYFLNGFHFLDDYSYFMIVFALALLNIFNRSLLDILNLPSRGGSHVVLMCVMAIILLQTLTSLPGFAFVASETRSFNILGFVLPSTYLSPLWVGIVSGVSVSLVSKFFYWLSREK